LLACLGLLHQVAHGDAGQVALGGAAAVFVFASVGLAQPDAGDEVWCLRFVGVEIAVHCQQHKQVFLRVAPAPVLCVSQQPVHQLGDQVVLRVIEDQGVEQDGVCAPVRAQQQVVLVIVSGGEVSCTGGFYHAVVHLQPDGLQVRLGAGGVLQHGPQPANGVQREFLQRSLVDQFHGLTRVCVAHQVAHIQCISRKRAPGFLSIPGRVIFLDIHQVLAQAPQHIRGYIVAFERGALQGMGGVDGVEGDGFLAAAPVRDAAVRVLQPLQTLDVALDRTLDFLG